MSEGRKNISNEHQFIYFKRKTCMCFTILFRPEEQWGPKMIWNRFLEKQNKIGTKPSGGMCHSSHAQLSPPLPDVNPLLPPPGASYSSVAHTTHSIGHSSFQSGAPAHDACPHRSRGEGCSPRGCLCPDLSTCLLQVILPLTLSPPGPLIHGEITES